MLSKKIIVSLFVLIGLSQLTGCASIVSGSSRGLSVETKYKGNPVEGAKCKLVNDKGTWFLTTPGSATVHDSYNPLRINCEKDDFEPGTRTVDSSTKAWVFGNILFGGIIGAGIDIMTGAAYEYPESIVVNIDKTTTN